MIFLDIAFSDLEKSKINYNELTKIIIIINNLLKSLDKINKMQNNSEIEEDIFSKNDEEIIANFIALHQKNK